VNRLSDFSLDINFKRGSINRTYIAAVGVDGMLPFCEQDRRCLVKINRQAKKFRPLAARDFVEAENRRPSHKSKVDIFQTVVGAVHTPLLDHPNLEPEARHVVIPTHINGKT
jgi:hypothetical protein